MAMRPNARHQIEDHSMLNAALLLRIASVVSLFFAAGHTLGGLKSSWSPIGETDVLATMRTFRFDVEGVNRSYLEFYRGFGFLLTVYLVLQAVLLWQLAGLAKANPNQAQVFVWTFFVASIAIGVLTWKFLFPIPVYFDAVVTVCLGLALIANR
jgi:heme O synthase-like polyprenyltransferase